MLACFQQISLYNRKKRQDETAVNQSGIFLLLSQSTQIWVLCKENRFILLIILEVEKFKIIAPAFAWLLVWGTCCDKS
jgi:hypothetical protein